MNKTDKEVLELCKSWFEDIAERSDRLTSGNVSHCGRAIHGVATHYTEFVNEHLHNIEHKPTWSEEDERICRCLIKDQKEGLNKVNNSESGHIEIISDLKEMYRERINWLESIKLRMK